MPHSPFARSKYSCIFPECALCDQSLPPNITNSFYDTLSISTLRMRECAPWSDSKYMGAVAYTKEVTRRRASILVLVLLSWEQKKYVVYSGQHINTERQWASKSIPISNISKTRRQNAISRFVIFPMLLLQVELISAKSHPQLLPSIHRLPLGSQITPSGLVVSTSVFGLVGLLLVPMLYTGVSIIISGITEVKHKGESTTSGTIRTTIGFKTSESRRPLWTRSSWFVLSGLQTFLQIRMQTCLHFYLAFPSIHRALLVESGSSTPLKLSLCTDLWGRQIFKPWSRKRGLLARHSSMLQWTISNLVPSSTRGSATFCRDPIW